MRKFCFLSNCLKCLKVATEWPVLGSWVKHFKPYLIFQILRGLKFVTWLVVEEWWRWEFGWWWRGSWVGQRLPVVPCSGLLFVILHRHNEEDQECDSLNGGQEEEVVIQCAPVDVAYREKKRWEKGMRKKQQLTLMWISQDQNFSSLTSTDTLWSTEISLPLYTGWNDQWFSFDQ